MRVLDIYNIDDGHEIISEYENLTAALSVVTWHFAGKRFDEPEDRRHRSALMGISDALENLRDTGMQRPVPRDQQTQKIN